MIKLVALDFDGTTADTMPTLENIAVKLITKNYNITEDVAREKYRNTTGLPFIQQMELIYPGNNLNESVVKQFEQEKINSIFELPLFADARETIQNLKQNNFMVAISSSTTQPTIEKYCQKHQLMVDQILGFREGFEKGTDHFNYLIKKFSVEPHEIVYVGDSLKDYERANSNGILFIGKIGMFDKQSFNAQANEEIITINNLNELIKILEKLNRG